MHGTLRLLTSSIQTPSAISICICLTLVFLFPDNVFAQEKALVEAFNTSDKSTDEDQYRVSFQYENCVFKKITINPDYCARSGQGAGDRIITTHIDLREVEKIRTSHSSESFHINFDMDYDKPGFMFIMKDRLINGEEGNFERFSKRMDEALKAAELASHKSFSNCEGTPAKPQKQSSLVIITDNEPEGWKRLVELSQECRAPKSLEFEEG